MPSQWQNQRQTRKGKGMKLKIKTDDFLPVPRVEDQVDSNLAPSDQEPPISTPKKFDELSGLAATRKNPLEESRKWHQLSFDVDCELQWIAEKKPLASSEETGRTLTEALNMVKKQDQLEAEVQQLSGHIEGTIGQGEGLVRGGHRTSSHIKAKCEQLAGAWSHLTQMVRQRRQVVDWGVKEQQYMFDAADIESWMNEKRAALVSADYGVDEDAAQKLLAKHKALQNDMNTYRQWVEKLAVKCTELVDSERPNVERFANRQADLEAEFERLARLAEERRRSSEDAVCLYEYMRESADLEQWINEQLHTAMSEDYGEDYEHLKELQSKFEEFKQSVKTISERFVSCETAANSILRSNPPSARDILKKQEKLSSVWTLFLDYIESRDQKLVAAEAKKRKQVDGDQYHPPKNAVGKATSVKRLRGEEVYINLPIKQSREMSVNFTTTSKRSAGADMTSSGRDMTSSETASQMNSSDNFASMILAEQDNSFLQCELDQTKCGVTRCRRVSVENMTAADVDALAQFLRSRDLDVEDSTKTVANRLETSPLENSSIDDVSQLMDMDTYAREVKKEKQDENESDSNDHEENAQENVLETEETETVEDDEIVAVSFLPERANSVKREDEPIPDGTASRACVDYNQESSQQEVSVPSSVSSESDVIVLDATSSVISPATSSQVHPEKELNGKEEDYEMVDAEAKKKDKIAKNMVIMEVNRNGRKAYSVRYTKNEHPFEYLFVYQQTRSTGRVFYHCYDCSSQYRKNGKRRPPCTIEVVNGQFANDISGYAHLAGCTMAQLQRKT